tara:strand:- start:270 stop:608 length:339 start_codon:yes stop_codon:yes gene_type:complete
MKSIKPRLGRGLGDLKDKFRGKIFPQFIISNNKKLDKKFALKPALIISNEIKKKISLKIKLIRSKNIKNLELFFKENNCKAVIVRPDRFILSSCKSIKNFNSYLSKNLSHLA